MIEELQEINRFGDKKHLEAAYAKEQKMKKAMLEGGPMVVDNGARLKKKYNT